MAEQTPKPAPKPTPPFPGNWARMSSAEKRAWQEKNRGGPNTKVQPAKPAAQPTKSPPAAQEEEYNEEKENQEGTALENEPYTGPEPTDEVTVTIQFPGQDVRQMTGKEFIRRLLGGLSDALGGAGGVS